MKLKKIAVLVTGLILSTSLGITAYAAGAGETAYVYGFDYGDGVDTTAIADQERMYLSNLGYQAYCNKQVAASFAIGTSPTTSTSRMNSGVVAFNGHAGPGSFQFLDNEKNNTYLTAIKSGGLYTKFGDTSMSNCKAALFFGCKTASSDRASTYGVLTTKAVDKGADCAFGWTKSVSTSSATTFRERMFYFLRYGYAVKDAAANAASEMPWLDETKNYIVSGAGTTKLTLNKSAVQDDNTITNEEALKMIENDDYRLMNELEDGTKVYVRHINDIPTLESIDIYPDSISARKTGLAYSVEDVERANAIHPIEMFAEVDIPKTIMEGCMQFNKIGTSESINILCKLNDEVKLVEIIKTEYISNDQECYYLDTICIDLNTGEQLDYLEIINSII